MLIGALENGRIPQNRADEIVHDGWTKGVRVVHLAFIFRLVALGVENRVDGIGECWLEAAIVFESDENLIVVVEIVVDASGKQPFAVAVRDVASESIQACCASCSRNRTEAAARVARCRRRPIDAWRGVIESENPLVERDRRRIVGRKTCIQYKVLKSWAGHENLSARPEGVPNSFRVREEKGFVPLDWTAESRGPLIVVLKRARHAAGVVKEIVCAKRAASPVIDGVAVETVSAGFRVVVNLSARLSAVLPSISVAYHSHFLDFVPAQQQVTRTGVIEIQEGIVVIVAVDGEKVCGSRQAERAEIPESTAAGGIHSDARRRLSDVSDIAAGIGYVLDLPGIKIRADVSVLGLHFIAASGNFHTERSVAQLKFQIGGGCLAQNDGHFGNRHTEAGFLNLDGVVSRPQKRK